jgi:hypothetical protein
MYKFQWISLLPIIVATLCVVASAYIILNQHQIKKQGKHPYDNQKIFNYANKYKPYPRTISTPYPRTTSTPHRNTYYKSHLNQPLTIPLSLHDSFYEETMPDSSNNNSYIETIKRPYPTIKKNDAMTPRNFNKIKQTANTKINNEGEYCDRKREEYLKAPMVQERRPLHVNHDLVYKTKSRQYCILSEHRDTNLYPNSSYYRSTFPLLLRNVIAVTLNLAVIPVTEYNVNIYNNCIDIEDNGTVYEVYMPVGQYDSTSLTNFANAVQDAITSTHVNLSLYTVSINELTSKMTIFSNGNTFRLLYRTGPNVNKSTWKIFGFQRTDTPSDVMQLAPGVVDLLGTLSIYLFADELTNSLNGPLAQIDLDKQTPSNVVYYNSNFLGGARFFWPIGKLHFLTLRFLVPHTEILSDGNQIETYREYQFEGRQNNLFVDVITKEYHNTLEDNVELDVNA